MKLKQIAATSALTVLSLSATNTQAHPSWVTGTSNLSQINAVPASVTDPADPAKITNNANPTTSSSPSRGYLEDGVRIGHGCSNEAGQYGPGSAVNAVSWV